MKKFLFDAVLWPLISRDFALRAAGKRPDRMYWADALALRLGMLEFYPDTAADYDFGAWVCVESGAPGEWEWRETDF